MGRSAYRFSIEDEGCVRLARGRWAYLKRADCRGTERLIIEVSLEIELGVAGG
jgi:hypothetical protein